MCHRRLGYSRDQAESWPPPRNLTFLKDQMFNVLMMLDDTAGSSPTHTNCWQHWQWKYLTLNCAKYESLQFSGVSVTLENAQNCSQIRSALERQDVLITMFIFGNHSQIFLGGVQWRAELCLIENKFSAKT